MYNSVDGSWDTMREVCGPGYDGYSEFFVVPESNPLAQQIKDKFEAVMRHSCD